MSNNSEEILMEIDVDGTLKVEAKGVVGSGCDALTQFIEEAVGDTIADEKKPEYEQVAFQTLGSKAAAPGFKALNKQGGA